MDPAGRKEMLELIRDIARKESMNIIISSHLLPDIESTCRQVVIMNKGRIAAEESIAGLKKDKRNVFEIKVVGDREAFFAALRCPALAGRGKGPGPFPGHAARPARRRPRCSAPPTSTARRSAISGRAAPRWRTPSWT